MIDKIKVFPRFFVEESIHLFIKHNIGIISIVEYPKELNTLFTDSFKIEKNLQDIPIITLDFHDLTDQQYNGFNESDKELYKLFDVEMAKSIINFVDTYKDKIKLLIVHCAAGVSRSGAVGYWANKYLNLDDKRFLKENPFIFPNHYVYDVLYKTSGLRDKIENDLSKLFLPDGNVNSSIIF